MVAAARELAQRDAVALAVELQLDAVVDDALALQPLADARLDEQIDRALLEHAGADPVLDVARGSRSSSTTDSMPSRSSRCARVSPAGPAPTMPTCVRISPGLSARLVEHALGDREGAVRRRHAAVDRAVQQHLLDLVGRQAVAQRRPDVHARARPRGRARRARRA